MWSLRGATSSARRVLRRLPRLSGQRREPPTRSTCRAAQEAQPNSSRLLHRQDGAGRRLDSAFKRAGEADLDRAATWFRARRRKAPAVSFSAGAPQPGRPWRTVDPTGIRFDLYFKMEQRRVEAAEIRRTRAHASSASTTSTAHAGRQQSYDFYTGLGFRLTEYTRPDDRDPKKLLGGGAAPQRGKPTNLAFTTAWPAPGITFGLDRERARYLHLCDVMATSGYPAETWSAAPAPTASPNSVLSIIPRSRRPPRRAVHNDYSTAIPTTSRFRWSLRDPQRQGTLWGPFRRRKSWFEEGSVFSQNAGAGASDGAAADRWRDSSNSIVPKTRGGNYEILKRRISAAVWELLMLLVIAIVFAKGLPEFTSGRAGWQSRKSATGPKYQNGETGATVQQMTAEHARTR